MPWGAVIGAAVGLYGASKQSSAAKSAANTQAQAADKASQIQWDIYQQSRNDNLPFQQNALTAQQQYMALLGLSPYSGQPTGIAGGAGPQTQGSVTGAYQSGGIGGLFGGNPKRQTEPMLGDVPVFGQQATQAQPQVHAGQQLTPEQAQQAAFANFRNAPGYQFGLNTGFDQVQASAAARGGLYSGATMKALDKFGRDYADQQGYQPYMNSLANLAGMGQVANSQTQLAGQNYANQAGYNLNNAASARASGITQSADAWGQAASGIGGLVGKYWGGGWGGV